MKSIIGLLIITTILFAQESCNSYANVAGFVMQERQTHGDITVFIDKLPEPQTQEDRDDYETVVDMAVLAWSWPYYQQQSHKEEAVVLFRNQFYIECVKIQRGE